MELNTSSFLYSSDRRLKKDVFIIGSALDTVKDLEGVTFNWKESGEKDIGFIAQDVEKVVPALVNTAEDGMKSVKYGNITAILVEAMKEQQEQIEALQEELKALQSR